MFGLACEQAPKVGHMVRGREGAEHGLGVRKKGREPMDILLMLPNFHDTRY